MSVDAGFLDQSPSAFLRDPREAFLETPTEVTPPPAPAPRLEDTPDFAKVAIGIAAALVILRMLMKAHLAAEHPRTDEEVRAAADRIYGRIFPTWARAALPAVAQAYKLGATGDVSYAELEQLASDYVAEMGAYVHQTSLEALTEGFNAQIAARWSPELAWVRTREAWGLDKQQMRSYIAGVAVPPASPLEGSAPMRYEPDLVPPAARSAIDRAFLHRADRLGQNEAFKASQVGRNVVWLSMQAANQLPAGVQKRWDTAEDEKVCPICGYLDGQQRDLSDRFETAGGEKFYAPGVHPNCFPAGTVVSGPQTLATMSRWYEGEMVRIVTADGSVLTVTPQHPLLTDKGWIAAGLVDDQTQLVRETGLQRMTARDPDNYQAPALIEDVLPPLGESASRASSRMPVTAEDFHGDGFDGYVDVVRADGLLLHRSEVGQPGRHQCLLSSPADALSLSSGRDPFPVLRALALSPDGVVRRYGQTRALSRIGLAHPQDHALGAVALMDPVLTQDSADSSPRDAQIFRQALDAVSGAVTLEHVVQVIRFPFAGHVFNLQTADGWYIANGFIVHNCRCTLSLVYPPEMLEDITKAKGDDPYDRDRRGRFAEREERETTQEKPASWSNTSAFEQGNWADATQGNWADAEVQGNWDQPMTLEQSAPMEWGQVADIAQQAVEEMTWGKVKAKRKVDVRALQAENEVEQTAALENTPMLHPGIAVLNVGGYQNWITVNGDRIRLDDLQSFKQGDVVHMASAEGIRAVGFADPEDMEVFHPDTSAALTAALEHWWNADGRIVSMIRQQAQNELSMTRFDEFGQDIDTDQPELYLHRRALADQTRDELIHLIRSIHRNENAEVVSGLIMPSNIDEAYTANDLADAILTANKIEKDYADVYFDRYGYPPSMDYQPIKAALDRLGHDKHITGLEDHGWLEEHNEQIRRVLDEQAPKVTPTFLVFEDWYGIHEPIVGQADPAPAVEGDYMVNAVLQTGTPIPFQQPHMEQALNGVRLVFVSPL